MSSPALARMRDRRVRVTAERLSVLAHRLTERDREIADALFEHRILTSAQLTLLFFSSRRRALDRLLFLHREGVVDRFYPAGPFGQGKPQAHWLLDEAGAHVVAAYRDVERKQLGWQRRENWAGHPQLAHRLEINHFVSDLIAATLPHPARGVLEWWGASVVGRMPDTVPLIPDAGFRLVTPAGVIDCLLEWDRGTEPAKVLGSKLRRYRKASGRAYPHVVLFVVPSARRVRTLHAAAREAVAGMPATRPWPTLAATVCDLAEFGALGRIWQPLGDEHAAPQALEALPGGEPQSWQDPADALGRLWRKDRPDFWHALCPLGAPAPDDEEEWR